MLMPTVENKGEQIPKAMSRLEPGLVLELAGAARLGMLVACLVMSSACTRKTVVASTCEGERCIEEPECSAAEQQLPENCEDRDAGLCFGERVERDDEVACDACYEMIREHNVGAAVARCGCTYCAVQLTACFASAETEADGDSMRDRLCQAMVECGWAAGCAGSDCYCGEGIDRDACLKNANEGRLLGACAEVIQAAANCPEGEPAGNCVLGRQLMPGTAHDRATEVSKCVSGDPLVQGNLIVPKCQ